MKKALVLYSGGLDSRLVVRILQDQGFEVEALYFALPFGCGCCNVSCNFNFAQKEEVKMTIFDVNKGELLREYLEILKKPKFGTGAGINPCRDCKIFMFRKAREYALENGIEVIATGEVLGQRPMSQVSSAMKIIDEEIGFEVLRPLSAKVLKETSWEESGLVDRDKLFGIVGRRRKEQMALAEEYGIKYPSPGGGCFLCEAIPSARLKILLDRDLINENTLPLTMIGRHFFINGILSDSSGEDFQSSQVPFSGDASIPSERSITTCSTSKNKKRGKSDGVWFVVARDALECEVVSGFESHVADDIGKPAVFYNDEKGEGKALELQEAYSSGDNEDKRELFSRFKI